MHQHMKCICCIALRHVSVCMSAENFDRCCRIPGERIDIWLVRYNGMGPANYWGFKQLRYTEAEEVRLCSHALSYLCTLSLNTGISLHMKESQSSLSQSSVHASFSAHEVY